MVDTPAQKHLDRREKVLNKQSKFLTEDVKRNSGILAITILYFWDSIVELIFKVLFATFDIGMYAFNYMYNLIFGATNGIIPSDYKNGTVVTWRPMRYMITFFVPPLGVFMSKGLMGWFNIIICLLLCYINYILGILYAFIITSNNRYSDRFEKKKIKEFKEKERGDSMPQFKIALIIIVGLLLIIFFTIFSASIREKF